MACENKESCSCPHTECPNHGICCKCIKAHLGYNSLVHCMAQVAKNIEKKDK